MSARKKQVRFNGPIDTALLREVLAINPYTEETKDGWEVIARNVSFPGFEIDARRSRERTTRLMDYYKADEVASLRKSGSEEDYAEKEQLLEELVQLEREAQHAVDKAKRKEDTTKRQQADELRKKAMERLPTKRTLSLSDPDEGKNEDVENDVKPKRRGSNQTNPIIDYLKQKHDGDTEAKKREMDIKEADMRLQADRLQLERDRLEMDRKDREARFNLEREERMALISVLLKK